MSERPELDGLERGRCAEELALPVPHHEPPIEPDVHWVFEVFEGDGNGHAFGVDYSECGIVKYLARERASELAPYLCWCDYPMAAAAHVRLDRAETLAQGGQRCDFRFSRRQPARVEPAFVHP